MRLTTLLLLFAVLFIAAESWQWWLWRPGNRPSSFFRILDGNKDGLVTRIEWEAGHLMVGNSEGSSVLQRYFEWSDCNRDGHITWQEYRSTVMQLKTCIALRPEDVESNKPLSWSTVDEQLNRNHGV
jgi:hypothetical protein